jgi:hypothetical protein
MDYTLYALSKTPRNSVTAKKDHCSRYQSPLDSTQVRQQSLTRRRGPTSVIHRRCANGNVTIPQIRVVVSQRDATGRPLARRLDPTRKGMRLACILLIRSHAHFDLPVSEMIGQVTNSRNHRELTRSSSGLSSHSTMKGYRRSGWCAWQWELQYHETQEVGPLRWSQ